MAQVEDDMAPCEANGVMVGDKSNWKATIGEPHPTTGGEKF